VLQAVDAGEEANIQPRKIWRGEAVWITPRGCS
jgi:hypothetical protein